MTDLQLILNLAEGSTTANTLQHIAEIARRALAQSKQRNLTEQEHDVLVNSIKASSTVVSKGFLAQPQQEQYIGEKNVELGFYSDVASNGQQRGLASKVEMGQLVGDRTHESASNPDTERAISVIAGVDEYGPMLDWYTHWVNFPIGTKLYTSPPEPSKPPTILRSNT